MNQPLLPKKSSSGQKKKFHFHDKKAGTTVVYTTNKENEKTSSKTSHFGSLATFRNISSVTKKSTHSSSSTSSANISSFFKPVNVQHASSEKEAVKKGKPPVLVTTGFTSTSFSPSLSKNEIPVGKATILRNKENNVDDILGSLNEDGDEQNLVKNPLASAGHVTKRSNSKFPDVEKMKAPSASKRYFTDVDTGSVSDSEFLPQSNELKRLKKASCDDDIDEEPDNVVNGYQESYFNGDDEFDDIQHELEWLRCLRSTPQSRYMYGDRFCLVILTPLAMASAALCVEGSYYYISIGQWVIASGLITLCTFLIMLYVVWLVLSMRYHLHMWHKWRQMNQVVN